MAIFVAGCGGGGGGGDTTLTSKNQGEDPVVLEVPVAYIKRPIPDEDFDLRDPLNFNPGAELFVRERASASADEINITEQIATIVAAEEGVTTERVALDIKGLESSYDGGTLIFAARAVVEPVATNLEFTTWNLWLFDLETGEAQYLIPSRIKRNDGVETGGGQDIAPHFLPDDRILFSSTRQVANQARQLNEGRGQIFAALTEGGNDPAAVLHIYDPNLRGAEFQQISFNLSHDLDPAVRASGEIVFSRWNNTTDNHISLYQISPSGLTLSPLYGVHSQNSGTNGVAVEYTQPRELDDGRIIALTRSFSSPTFGGEIVVIDPANYIEQNQPAEPGAGASDQGQESLTTTEVRTDGLLSRGGQYGSVYPLRDGTGRLLVTWSDCRVIDESALPPGPNETPAAGDYLPCTLQTENPNAAPPLYGAWVYDTRSDTQLPVVIAQEGYLISEIIAAEPRDFPRLTALPLDYNADLATEMKGQLLIDSVYDLDGIDTSPMGIARYGKPGTAAFNSRPARFLRLVEPVTLPDPDVYEIPRFAYGVTTAFSFREIAGYVPVEPDGSVTVNVAANRPFSFSVLDSRGRRIGQRHNYWLQLGPGEVLRCTGCHDGDNGLPHGRADTQIDSSNPGAAALADGRTGFPGTDSSELFATETGQTMAAVWDFHRPLGNEVAADRELLLSPTYADEWSSPDLTPDPDIADRDYDPGWLDIPADKAIIVNNLDPGEPARIVINYIDHIQVIWDRERDEVPGSNNIPIERCVGCHSSAGGTLVPAGQLDLTSEPSAIDPDHYRSYRELLDTDLEQWLDNADLPADRVRVCTELDDEGNTLTSTVTLPLGNRMRAGSANASTGFFECFEGFTCGPNVAPELPSNCTEDGGTPVQATTNTVNHSGMLSASELRLLSEWLDIGAQYYNNPFDARLGD